MDAAVAKELISQGISVLRPEAEIAKKITDNEHFKLFLRAIKVKDRKTAYEAIAPYLKFKPNPYWFLMR